MKSILEFRGNIGDVVFDFSKRKVFFLRDSKNMTLVACSLGYYDCTIHFDEITEIEYKKGSLFSGYPSFSLIVNGKRIVNGLNIDLTEFHFNYADSEKGFETLQRLANECNITEFKKVGRKDITTQFREKIEENPTEIRMKCNICGKVYCYSMEDIKNNLTNKQNAAHESNMAALNAVTLSHVNASLKSQQSENFKNQIVDYNKCQQCGSTDVVQIDEEEFKKINKISTNTTHSQLSSADELKKFKELLDSGIITQEEFDEKKKQLLGL